MAEFVGKEAIMVLEKVIAEFRKNEEFQIKLKAFEITGIDSCGIPTEGEFLVSLEEEAD